MSTFRYVSRRAGAEQYEVGLREGASGSTPAYDITLSRAKRYDITNPNPTKPELTPRLPGQRPEPQLKSRNGRIIDSFPRFPPFPLLYGAIESPFDDVLALGLSHTHVTSPMILACV